MDKELTVHRLHRSPSCSPAPHLALQMDSWLVELLKAQHRLVWEEVTGAGRADIRNSLAESLLSCGWGVVPGCLVAGAKNKCG